LKSYQLLKGSGRGPSPAFDATLRRLYPEVDQDPEEAVQLAGHLIALRRRLERADVARDAKPEAPARSWWRFWELGAQ
ncbi:MAG: hypothetical protein WD939_10720, partial [Dehalococcoidia bacterium]